VEKGSQHRPSDVITVLRVIPLIGERVSNGPVVFVGDKLFCAFIRNGGLHD